MPSKKEQENLQHCCCFFVFLNSLFKCEKLIISINKFQYKVKRALIGQISFYDNKIAFSFDLCPSNQILSRYLTKSIHTLFGYFLPFISDNSKKSCRIKDCQNFVNVDFKWYIYVQSTLKNFQRPQKPGLPTELSKPI